jgi:hypothetical protein
MRVTLLTDSYRRSETADDGSTVSRKYLKGQTIEVTQAVGEALCKVRSNGKAMAQKVQDAPSTQTVPRTTTSTAKK